MIYHLFQLLKDYDFPGHGLMNYLTFRAILASMISLLVALFAGKRIIRSLLYNPYQNREVTENEEIYPQDAGAGCGAGNDPDVCRRFRGYGIR